MKILVFPAALFLVLGLAQRAAATTPPKQKLSLARVTTNQVIPRDTLRAGQDIELRKVQAMLSGQRPKKSTNTDQRR
ncbi:MAG TPA: hypothetical protein VE954_13320 [Oligoflexus sp.]|uniref:hypothetical protein n=1 Tax=Oligoflexus sp. TaxID=1971216 RepID=UPI002D2844D7|nr:hypothetical protein [Oligoflexus sp.]HYX34086.1 hypothetical protein [Oligoflexus sp.]